MERRRKAFIRYRHLPPVGLKPIHLPERAGTILAAADENN